MKAQERSELATGGEPDVMSQDITRQEASAARSGFERAVGSRVSRVEFGGDVDGSGITALQGGPDSSAPPHPHPPGIEAAAMSRSPRATPHRPRQPRW